MKIRSLAGSCRAFVLSIKVFTTQIIAIFISKYLFVKMF